MIWKEESQLLQNIKQKHLYRVTLLYGEEKYLKDLYLKKLIRLAVGDSDSEFNLHRFDGTNLNVDQMLEACESFPFFAEQRCVTVEKFDYEGLAAQDKAKIDAYLQEPVESTVLLLIVDKEDFNPKKSTKAKKLVELCDKAGAVLCLNRRSASDMARFIRTRAESRGCTISRELCSYMLERCEGNMLALSNEVEKLTAYVTALPGLPQNKDGRIDVTKAQIDQVTSKAMDASIFDLAKAILADRYEKAMTIIEELLYLRYQPTVILSTLAGAYLDLYIAKIARNAGKDEQDIKKAFRYQGRDFVIRNSMRDCAHYKTDVLRRSIRRLAEVDLRLKSSRADDVIILEQTVTELFLLAK